MAIGNKIFSHLDSQEMVLLPPPGLLEILLVFFEKEPSAKKKPRFSNGDPSLTTRMLRVSDMSASAVAQKADDRNQPGAISNSNGAKLLILSIAIYNQLSDCDLLNNTQFAAKWQRMLKTANAAQDIALRTGSSSIEKAYICALLQNFGSIFLERYFPEKSSQVKRLIADGVPVLNAEREIFETNHQEVGSWVATKWNLPQSLAEVINNHHLTDETMIPDLPLLSRISLMADKLVSVNLESPDNPKVRNIDLKILEECGRNLGIRSEDVNWVYGALPKHLIQRINSIDHDSDQTSRYFLQMDNQFFALYLGLADMFRERRKLSRQLLQEGRFKGALDSLKITLATLSHYVNNAMMNIDGQGEILQQLYESGDKEQIIARIPTAIRANKNATAKISKVLNELSKITNLENIEYFKDSSAIDIEKSLKDCLG